MPDGDIIHSRLTRLYHKLHQWLCEGKANSDECARTAMEALKGDIKRKGNLPVMLAKQMGESLEQTIKEAGESGSVDWTGLNLEFDRLAQKTDGPHYLKELTLHASKSILRDLRYGREIDTDNFSEAILKRYIYQVYKSAFKERIPPTPEDYAGTDEVTLNNGNRPAQDPSLHLRHMLVQVSTFRRLLSTSDNPNFQWQALTKEFLALDDIVDRSATAENLLPADMQSRLIKLYRTYVAEWDTVKSQIAADLLDKDGEQQAYSTAVTSLSLRDSCHD